MWWAEGPVWFADGRYLLVSDIPSNRIMRWDEASCQWGVYRVGSNHANGHARDEAGRLISCEHLTRRITRTEIDGSITVLADQYQGKRLNSPNDIVCQMKGADRGAIWFTDPPFGISGNWEGAQAHPELPDAVYRIGPQGELQQVISDLRGPNGLAFSPDESLLYVIESRAVPSRCIWSYRVGPGGVLSHRTLVVDAQGAGALDGMAVDAQGNLWCGFGSDGRVGADSPGLDGVRVFNPQGQAIGHIHLPERCANLCFGGPKGNTLYMASTHSLYALHMHLSH
jgi:gluconolactonase